MQLQISKIRSLISEALSEDRAAKLKIQNVISFVDDITMAAQNYVASVAKGKADSYAAQELQEKTEKLNGYIAFLKRKNDNIVPKLSQFYSIANELSELSTFWKRPTIIGKRQYAFKVNEIFNNLLTVSKQIKTYA